MITTELLFSEPVFCTATVQPTHDDYYCIEFGGASIGSIDRSFPTALPFTPAGFPDWAIYDVIYNQLHFLPSTTFDLGNVYQDQVIPIYIWNTTDSTVTFDPLVSEHPAGSAVEISMAPLPRLSSREGTLYVYKAGPSSTNATYTFVSSMRTIVVQVTASRVIILPVLPDWGHSIDTAYEFETVLEQNLMLYEQRRPLVERPRRKTSFTVQEDGASLQMMRNLCLYGDGRTFLVPIFSEPFFLSGAGGSTLSVLTDIADHWNLTRLCQIVVVYNFKTKKALGLEIASVNAETGTIMLSRDLSEPLQHSDVVVYPAFVGVLTRHKEGSVSSDFGTYSVEFTEFAGEDQPDLADISAPAPIFPFVAEWSNEPEVGFSTLQTVISYPGTAESLYSRGFMPPAELTCGFKFLSREKSAQFLDYFCSKKGRAGSFQIRGPHREFELIETILPDNGNITVRDNGYGSIFDSASHPEIYIIGPDGEIYDRTVTSVSPGEPGVIVLSIDTTLGVTVEPGAFIGKRYTVRFGKDSVEISHSTDSVSTTETDFFELIHEAAT